jgi:glycosyltransferase involved in cell wall biosynthesis
VLNRKRVFVNRVLIRPLTQAFVAVSQDVRNRLQRFEGVDARKVRVIYNGVAPRPLIDPATRAQLRSSLGFGPNDFVIGTVGRFDSIKNLPMLVRGIAAVGAHDPRVRGLLVGDGPEMPRIRALVDALQLQGRVSLTGFREDARELTQCMDLFVLSSFSEGTSMALLEAMAANVPVVVTDVGGNPEIVKAGESGWVVPSDDVSALTAALSEALRDTELCARRASAGARRFNENFRFDRMLDQYRDLYRELLGPAA